MKISFEDQSVGGSRRSPEMAATVAGETMQLRDVVLCPPTHLVPVACCSVTRESIRDGHVTDRNTAIRQHEALERALARRGVTCHALPARSEFPDQCFTRDVAVATPWGLVALNPAMPHRAAEADHLRKSIAGIAGPSAAHIAEGKIEGGDVCIARPGLVIVGISEERTDEAGANAFAARFRAEAWDVLLYRFDPHFLHLDTIFCMIDETRALACVEVLDDWFLDALAARGVRVVPVTYKEARKLGCNILSIDGKAVLASAATPRVSAAMRAAGFEVIELDVDQFAACGGGIHCLTMPLRRGTVAPARRRQPDIFARDGTPPGCGLAL